MGGLHNKQQMHLEIWPRHGNKTHTRGYPPVPSPFWRGKPELTGFGFGFGFSPILKDGDGAGNGDIDTHPEPVPEPAPFI
jgi:hypothetical protein